MGGTKKADILADCPDEVRATRIIARGPVSGKMRADTQNPAQSRSCDDGAPKIHQPQHFEKKPDRSRYRGRTR
ncbi:hypothetical protein MSSD14B_18310 [Marinobacter salsuginis]|uniref:Uncharacterized protein n=1 Tax=Marinobacter salsuginis TaxID=418719 RepID=A0A5M3PZ17_9GAMM|nr:hypothetical protein MS5N3_16710 [Marinobacter salsuginis]GBO88163.1 hypothetical protein MSSD14B_18310 [Marinobacter salsuginis]